MKQIYPPQNIMSPLENPNSPFPGPETPPGDTGVEQTPPYPGEKEMTPEQKAALQEVIDRVINEAERERGNQ